MTDNIVKFFVPVVIIIALITAIAWLSLGAENKYAYALLNSMFTMFYIEASGFGRGLGALDINKKSIENCYMLNPKLVNTDDRNKILTAFEQLKSREVMKVSDELKDEIRLTFEHTVLQSFGIDNYFNNIKNSLLSMQETRLTAKE